MTGRRAPSVHLCYHYQEPGDILINEVCVPDSGLTKQTYYCCLNWNCGQNGGGYCGIQDHNNGRNFIFSIWDPHDSSEGPLEPICIGSGTKCERFGGEGTGLKSWNFELGWKSDSWYTFVVRRWDQDGNTRFGLWVNDQREKIWHLITTLNFPAAGVTFKGTVVSFLEDWAGTGENVRRVLFRRAFKRLVDGSWKGFDKASFSMVTEESSQAFARNFDTGICDDAFFLQSGGNTESSSGLKPGRVLERITSDEPEVSSTDFRVTWSKNGLIEWELEASQPPQFMFKIHLDGLEVDRCIDTGIRKYKLKGYEQGKVDLIIENIYGRVSERTVTG